MPSAAAIEGCPPAGELELVAALQRRDDRAYATLIAQYGGQLFATTRRILGGEEDAKDALQDTFLSAFRSINAFAGKSRLGTWLHRIAVNAALMRLRRRRQRSECAIDDLLPQWSDDGHHVEPPCPLSDDGMRRLQADDSRAILRRAIDQLPANYRDVLVLRDLEELSTEDTSQLLGITPNATKIRLHRARQALRTVLGGCLEDLA